MITLLATAFQQPWYQTAGWAIADVLALIAICVSIWSAVSASKSSATADAAHKHSVKTSDRLTEDEQPKMSFDDLRLNHAEGETVDIECTLSNQSRLADAVMILELSATPTAFTGITPMRAFIFNLPSQSFAADASNRGAWPHSLPVNVGPMSTVTFKMWMYVRSLRGTTNRQPLVGNRVTVKLKTLRGQNLERTIVYEIRD